MEMLALLFTATSVLFDLPEGLLSAVCYVESSHRVAAMHLDDGGSNSVGVCQVKLTTAKMLGFRGTEKGLRVPEANVLIAAQYLRSQLDRYDGDVGKAVGAYNAGTYRLGRDGRPINRRYIHKVMRAWREDR
jgi:soluble lytic murein transglycosylase-like protein